MLPMFLEKEKGWIDDQDDTISITYGQNALIPLPLDKYFLCVSCRCSEIILTAPLGHRTFNPHSSLKQACVPSVCQWGRSWDLSLGLFDTAEEEPNPVRLHIRELFCC